jgi:hypothetical protein
MSKAGAATMTAGEPTLSGPIRERSPNGSITGVGLLDGLPLTLADGP